MTPRGITGTTGWIDMNGDTSETISYTINSSDTATAAAAWHRTSTGVPISIADLEGAFYDGIACKVAEEARIRRGKEYDLPDGSTLKIDNNGNYTIDDADAKVVYKANRLREFSPHLNASDMVAAFAKYAAELGVKEKQILQLPIELFVAWLVVEAAERDGDPTPSTINIESQIAIVKHPRCEFCQHYIPHLHARNRFPFCGPEHAVRFHQKRIASL